MTGLITGEAFSKMILNAAAAIENNKTEINELNVFPVPDGDTGTNMSLTMGAGGTALKTAGDCTVGRAAEITAGALLRGARGNSGVILSLLFRGMARYLKEVEAADAVCFAAALEAGVDAAYKAVMKPAEGTILTVSKLASAAATAKAAEEHDIELVLEQALCAGNEALADTINQNPVLKKAGVIDAGGKGYLYILDGMLRSLRGEIIETVSLDTIQPSTKADFTDFETEDITFAYCTEFIVGRSSNKDVNLLREFLDKRGDSIVVVEDDEIIKVHVHSNEPGVIITEALTYGALLTVKIENMREQHTEKVVAAEEAKNQRVIAAPEKKYGVVAVCAGEGIGEIFKDLGVDGIITGGQTMNPSTEDILGKIDAVPAEIVYVLPNNKNIIMAAEQCIPLSEKQVVVIPTKTIPQGISAMLAFEPENDRDENTQALCQALKSVHTVQVTYAARDSEFDGQKIKSGEYLALLDDMLLCSSSDIMLVMDVIGEQLNKFSPELITVFSGEDVAQEDAESVHVRIEKSIPDAEVSLVSGGQPVYYYTISAE